ncbi:MAG: protein kinase domain-containing protein [Anaerolineae bacterium]
MSSIHFLIGKQLGKYEVTEHISHGGMAEVYLGRQRNLDRQVAIKVLHPFLADEQGFVSRFQREARLVAALRHPNIVQVYDFDHHEELDIYYMVMEFIKGNTLKERLKGGPLDAEEAGAITAAIADALDYAHRREMVHRDIKPGNIMFTEEGDPVLADFGIARMLSVTGLTASGAMVGTPAYMAPEIGAGESATAASDIYSLGVVLYEMITGRLPFEADIPMSLVMKHINDPVPSPRQYAPQLPKALEKVLLKALAKSPRQRYATAGEMAKAVRQALDLDTPIYAPAPLGEKHTPTPGRATQDAEENRPLLRAWSDADTSPPPGELPSPQPQEKTRKSRTWRWILATFLLLILGGGGWMAIEGGLPEPLTHLLVRSLPVKGTANTPATSTPSPTVTLPPISEAATSIPITPSPTLTPTPTATQTRPAVTTARAEVLRLYVRPSDEAVPPETVVLAYITLRNGGNQQWPEGTRLAFVRGEQLGAPSTLALEPLGPGEQLQVLLPLHAPAEPDVYESIWEVQQPDGRSISSQIQLKVTVQEDLPTATPTPTLPPETPVVTPTVVAALTLGEPVLQSWEVQAERETWIGTLTFPVEGGTGNVRLYWDVIGEETEILNNELTFQWEQCKAFPLKVIATAGTDVVIWEGEIAYPAPEQCTAQP